MAWYDRRLKTKGAARVNIGIQWREELKGDASWRGDWKAMILYKYNANR